MKTRTQQRVVAPEKKPVKPAKPVLVSVPKVADSKGDSDKPKSKRGGFRPGAGRPAYLKPQDRKENAAYISMTDDEKAKLEAKAATAGLTLSFYLRKLIGLPIDE